MGDRPVVAIVGAGFSGAIVAARMLDAARDPLRIVLINRSGPMARGVAYGTRTLAHVLNVPAGRMSAYPEDEDDFLRFARQERPDLASGAFVARSRYGEYLEWMLDRAAARAAPEVGLERIVAPVTDLRLDGPAGRAVLMLGGGRLLRADRVVLAVGHYAPADPILPDPTVLGSPRYIRDPWAPGALESIDPSSRVFLLGTGLTMLDIALDLLGRLERFPLVALSRRGLVPAGHRPPGPPPTLAHRPPDLESGPATALAYLRSVRRHVERVACAGLDWREVVAALRPITPALWTRLDSRERARFLRHLRGYWEVHRHRAAPELKARLDEAVGARRLVIEAGRVVDLVDGRDGIHVSWRRRGRTGTEQRTFDWFVNCTGPDSNLARIDDPLIRSLRRAGLIQEDQLGQGVLTDADLALADRTGKPSPVLSYVGPLLRADHWEATAVPELRAHARAIAHRLVKELGPTERPSSAAVTRE